MNFAAAGFLILSFLFFLRVPLDSDLGLHLTIGKYIADSGTIPRVDFLSFPAAGYPYVYHSWLTELLLYLFYTKGNLLGVSIFYGLGPP